jgi:hypothetical protein
VTPRLLARAHRRLCLSAYLASSGPVIIRNWFRCADYISFPFGKATLAVTVKLCGPGHDGSQDACKSTGLVPAVRGTHPWVPCCGGKETGSLVGGAPTNKGLNSLVIVTSSFFIGWHPGRLRLGEPPVVYGEHPVPLAGFTVQFSQSPREPGEHGGRLQVVKSSYEVIVRASRRVRCEAVSLAYSLTGVSPRPPTLTGLRGIGGDDGPDGTAAEGGEGEGGPGGHTGHRTC